MRRAAISASVIAVAVAVAGLSMVGLSAPADAAVTTTNITSPVDGTHYLITNANPAGVALVEGTSNGTLGDYIDLRCYYVGAYYDVIADTQAVNPDGTFAVNVATDLAYGTCLLRAVPHNWPDGNSVTAFTGTRVTTEWNTSTAVVGGLNAGKVYDYYVLFQGASAMNDYSSTTNGGLWDSRLQYADGTSSNYLWYQNAALPGSEGTRSFLKVDGRNSYGPYSAHGRFPDNPGLPQLTYTATRNPTTGVTTIHETDPIVVCPNETPFPPTAGSCTQFTSAGVRLERTIITDDGGRQVHISDVWRSTDGHAHTISAHYDEWVSGKDTSSNSLVETAVSLKLPWLGGSFETFTSDTVFPGPARVPASVFVRNDNAAPDGNTVGPRGAVSFDVAPSGVNRRTRSEFVLRDDSITVPASGTHLVRQDFVIGTTDATVAAKAAANQARINPYRPDALIRKMGVSTYLGNNVYNATGINQSVTARTKRTRVATFIIRVQNDGTTTDSFKVKGPGSQTGFIVSYLAGAAGTTNITTAVGNGAYTLANLAPGQSRIFRLVVKVKAGVRIGALRSWLMVAWSAHDGTRRDAIKAIVRVVRS
jgi:hypothetical protein